MATPAAKRTLEVTEISTGNVVHTVDVTGKTDDAIQRVIMGMLINMSDKYVVGEADPEGDGP